MFQQTEQQYELFNNQTYEVYYDFTFVYIPSVYISWTPALGEQWGWKETRQEEATDLELLRYAEKVRLFDSCIIPLKTFMIWPTVNLYDKKRRDISGVFSFYRLVHNKGSSGVDSLY